MASTFAKGQKRENADVSSGVLRVLGDHLQRQNGHPASKVELSAAVNRFIQAKVPITPTGAREFLRQLK